ncbi:MAG: alpha/beta hydrolase [Planctomycetota bacterium]
MHDPNLSPTDQVDGVDVWRNTVLREIADWQQIGNVYAKPHTSTARPAIVLLHGGGWSGGSPDQYQPLAVELAQRFDVVVLCPNYRLVDRAKFPTQIQDAANAIRWLRAHAGRWLIDPQRIGVCGSSAGAYLAAMVALTHQNPLLAGGDAINGESAAVQALVVRWGPIDFIDRWYGNGGRAGPEEGMLGANYLQDPTIYHHASALSHVTAQAPPALFLQGREDRMVHQQQGELGHAAWQRHGCSSELILLNRIGHVEVDPADFKREIAAVIAFFAKQLKLKPR